jgi:hypothetical protein
MGRAIAGIGAAAVLAAGLMLAPAIGAQEKSGLTRRAAVQQRVGVGSFTPASADPRLAAMMARAGLDTSGFRFTPSSSDRPAGKPVTVAVRARSARGVETASVAAPAPSPVALAPIAYNLGAAVGWKRFALTGDLARVDLGAQPGSRESVDLGLAYIGKRASGRVKAGAQRAIGPQQPRALADSPSYMIDVGGSYSIARNIDVTAGVRYQAERDRLAKLADDRRDSQSLYVGTAFRF